MTVLHVLFIDDEPDIRDVIGMSLGLDPEICARGCASGKEGIAVAADTSPDVILLDVAMPVMDGPTTLAGLRRDRWTAPIPVIFMTARAQSLSVEQLKSLGALGVIAKPFNPMTLAACVQHLVRPEATGLAASRAAFLERVRRDKMALLRCRPALSEKPVAETQLIQIRDIAQGLAGAAGIFGFPRIGRMAADLGEVVRSELADTGRSYDVKAALDRLLTCIGAKLIEFADETPTTILDRPLFDDLRTHFSSDQMGVLLAKFDAQLESSLTAVIGTIPHQAELLREAHRLISTAGVLGFRAMSEVARELEDACFDAEERLAILVAILARAGEVKASTKRELGKVLAQMKSAA